MTPNDADDPQPTVITHGMTQYEAHLVDDRIVVTKRKRKHKFGEGYTPVGPERVIYEGTLRDASSLAEILGEVFSSDADA